MYFLRTAGQGAQPVEVFNRRGFFDFEVLACSKAHVKLVKSDSDFYIVLLG